LVRRRSFNHSQRNAVIGFTRVARRAGNQDAIKATAASPIGINP
jgi:hypothetical protein